MKSDHEEIWFWYQQIDKCQSSGMRRNEYCAEYKIDYKKFSTMYYKILYKKITNPALYEKNVPLARKYMKSDVSRLKFCKDNNIHIKLLTEMVTHLHYVDIIEEIKNKKESEGMKFVQVTQKLKPTTCPDVSVPEVVEKQNDIEIIITKGVKVSISPNIDSMKIIRIIELLKDL